MTGVTARRRISERAGSSEARVSPRASARNHSLTARRLFFSFSQLAALSPVHTLPHISVIPIAITFPVPVTLSLRLPLPRSSSLLRSPFTPCSTPLLSSPPPPSLYLHPPFSKLTSHSHKGHTRSYYRSGTEPIRIRTTALFLLYPPSVLPCRYGFTRARRIL